MRKPTADEQLPEHDGTTWRSFTRIPGAWSADGPALAHYWSSPGLRFNGFYLHYRGTGSV
ncbi:hypothetical protein [Streptomyces goshikiensis]|uniref:hypothetical protein n=1 Tax=Streptomyces goshikiensis TaxID=1942 RepID=UPI003666EC07